LPVRRRRIVEKFARPGRLLDVGCGNGGFLKTLEGSRWETYGMDIKRHHDLDLQARFFEGKFDHEMPPWSGFDAITLWHVFEHLYHPQRALRNASNLLRDGGFLLVAIPDLVNIDRWIFQKYWVGWEPPRHVATYSAKAIRTMVVEAGLHLEDIIPDVCTGEFILYSVDFFLHDHGIDSKLRRSLILRAMLAPFVFTLVRLGLAPAKIYAIRK
jgi:SAM-dependent methyltransferase